MAGDETLPEGSIRSLWECGLSNLDGEIVDARGLGQGNGMKHGYIKWYEMIALLFSFWVESPQSR